MRTKGKACLCQTLMTGEAKPCACVQGLLRQTLMTQMAGDSRMRTQGLHAPASDPGSAALQAARRTTRARYIIDENIRALLSRSIIKTFISHR